MEDKTRRDARLDLAKAIAIALVMIWHLQPLQLNLTNGSHFALKLLKFGLDQFYYQVTLLAVPLFFLVSSYLFFERMGDQVVGYAKKRFLRILWLFLLWSAIQFAVYYGIRLVEYIQTGTANFSLSMPVSLLIMQGGPGLPYVGGSIYYFLFVLLAVILLSALFGFLKDSKLGDVLGAVIILASLIHFEIGGDIPYWRVDNFLVYVPVSFFLWKDREDKKALALPVLFIAFALFSMHDRYLRQAGYGFEGYSRISIAIGAAALFSAILMIKNLKGSRAADFLSRYSLGIFATHKFWQYLVIAGLLKAAPALSTAGSGQPLDIWSLVVFVLVIAITILFIALVKDTRLKKIIS